MTGQPIEYKKMSRLSESTRRLPQSNLQTSNINKIPGLSLLCANCKMNVNFEKIKRRKRRTSNFSTHDVVVDVVLVEVVVTTLLLTIGRQSWKHTSGVDTTSYGPRLANDWDKLPFERSFLLRDCCCCCYISRSLTHTHRGGEECCLPFDASTSSLVDGGSRAAAGERNVCRVPCPREWVAPLFKKYQEPHAWIRGRFQPTIVACPPAFVVVALVVVLVVIALINQYIKKKT